MTAWPRSSVHSVAGMTLVSLPHPARGMDAEEYLAQIGRHVRRHRRNPPAVRPRADDTPVHRTGSRPPLQRMECCGATRRRPTRRARFVQFTSGSTGTPRGIALSLDALDANLTSMYDWLEPRGRRRRLQLVTPLPRHGADRPRPVRHVLGEPPMVHAVRARADDARIVPGRPGQLDAGLHRLPGHIHDLTTVRAASGRTFPSIAWYDSTSPRCEASWSGASRCRPTASASSKPSAKEYGLSPTRCAPGTAWPKRHWPSPSTRRPGRGRRCCSTPTPWRRREWQEVDEGGTELVSCGPPVLGTEVRTTGDTPLGELEIRSPSLLHGYVGDDSSPLTEDGWLHTADLGYVRNGEVYHRRPDG